MMIDLILASAIGLAFYGGFKCGGKFKTVGEMVSRGKEYVRSWL